MTLPPSMDQIRERNRYILNKAHLVAHDRTALTERCNTDDIERPNRRNSDYVPAGYRRCEWCMPEEGRA